MSEAFCSCWKHYIGSMAGKRRPQRYIRGKTVPGFVDEFFTHHRHNRGVALVACSRRVLWHSGGAGVTKTRRDHILAMVKRYSTGGCSFSRLWRRSRIRCFANSAATFFSLGGSAGKKRLDQAQFLNEFLFVHDFKMLQSPVNEFTG